MAEAEEEEEDIYLLYLKYVFFFFKDLNNDLIYQSKALPNLQPAPFPPLPAPVPQLLPPVSVLCFLLYAK